MSKDMNDVIDNMIRWAEDRLGDTSYTGWCLLFIEDALEKSNDIEIFGGDSAKESAVLYADGMQQGVPERGAFVFYDCICMSDKGPVNWGHCGISLGNGKVIHAWDKVRINDYLDIEKMTAMSGDLPKYIGWVPLERVMREKPMIYQLEDTSKVERLFEGWEQTDIYSCLQKVMGNICVTDPEDPQSAVANIGSFAYFAGEPERELVVNKRDGLVLMVPQNDDWAALIESCYPQALKVTRYALKKDTKFDTEALKRMAASLPEGYELRQIDAEIYDMCLEVKNFEDFVNVFESKEQYLELGRGIVVMKDGKIVSGASSYSRYREGIELEVDTLDTERRKGLATAACAALILLCLEEGLYPSWDAANRTSIYLAEKLGYEFSHEYIAYVVGADNN